MHGDKSPTHELEDNNIQAKMRIINSLNSEPKQVNHQMNHQMNDARMNIINNLNKNEPKEIPKKIIVNGTENDYILKRNLVNKCKNYIDSFTDRLINIHGNDPQTFKHRLRELDCPQLEILLENIRFEINVDGGKSLFNSAFFMIIGQTENLSNNYGYNITGLSKALQANNDVHDSLKELSCQMDLSSYTTPELRLASAVLLTALSCYNTNKLSDTMNKFMDEPIDDEIEEKYKDL